MGETLDKLKNLSIRIANFQIKFILLLIYFIIILPYGIFFFFKNNFKIRRIKKTSSWLDIEDKKQTIEALRRQF